MHLIEVDDVDLQAAQTGVAFFADGLRGVHLGDMALFVPTHGALGENVGALALPLLQCTRDNFFGVTETVDGGGVDPIDTKFEGAVNGGYGIVVFLRTPAELLAATADGPCAVAHRGYVDV